MSRYRSSILYNPKACSSRRVCLRFLSPFRGAEDAPPYIKQPATAPG